MTVKENVCAGKDTRKLAAKLENICEYWAINYELFVPLPAKTKNCCFFE